MRRLLVVLLAGVALAVVAGTHASGPAAAATYTIDGKTYTSNDPVTTDQLAPLPPGSRPTEDRSLPHDDTPAYVLLGAVALLVAAGLGLWLVTKLLALQPRWIAAGKHAFTEAGWRASNTWDEFRDWLRLGR